MLPGTPRTLPLSPPALCSQQDWAVTMSKDGWPGLCARVCSLSCSQGPPAPHQSSPTPWLLWGCLCLPSLCLPLAPGPRPEHFPHEGWAPAAFPGPRLLRASARSEALRQCVLQASFTAADSGPECVISITSNISGVSLLSRFSEEPVLRTRTDLHGPPRRRPLTPSAAPASVFLCASEEVVPLSGPPESDPKAVLPARPRD